MKKSKYYFIISIILILLSSILYLIHYLVFGQALNTAYYSLMNLCFIPINSLIVTILLEKLIEYKNHQDRIEKLNMLISIFFTEMGSSLMHLIIDTDENTKNLVNSFDDIEGLKQSVRNHKFNVDMSKLDLCSIKSILVNNNSLLINLISNESIHQHEIFTDLLMSIIHLRDEIVFVENNKFKKIDICHLKNDILRVYKNISIQWVYYIEYLYKYYPFLYDNAIRVNPFKFK